MVTERWTGRSSDLAPHDMAPSSFALAPGYGLGGVMDAILCADDPAFLERESADDAYWMRRALLCAMAAKGRASPNPTVGAVIVKDGALVATGATEPYGQRHAERCAIDNVADTSVLRGATIYTTLEPCAHWGKQPPCADLVASCGFERCVAGIQDPNPRVAGVGLERVRAAGAEVLAGVLRNEILAWHLPYIFPHLSPDISARPFTSVFAVDLSDGDSAAFLLGCSDGWDARNVSRHYRDWLKQKCDLLITEPTFASIDPAAFERGSWRGVVWWDMGGHFARMSVYEARDIGARARDLGIPVALVCTPDRDNVAQLDACVSEGITHIAPPAEVDPASWLTARFRGGELAALTGTLPSWVLIDDHPRLAEALAAAGAVDATHVIHIGGRRAADDGCTPSDDAVARPAWAATLSRIARNEVAGGTISEYCTQRLSSALGKTAW